MLVNDPQHGVLLVVIGPLRPKLAVNKLGVSHPDLFRRHLFVLKAHNIKPLSKKSLERLWRFVVNVPVSV